MPLITRSNCKTNPWFYKFLCRLRNKKKRLYQKAKRNPTACTEYKEFLKTLCSAISVAKDKYFTHDLPSLLKSDPKKIWKTISPDKGPTPISLHGANNVPLSDHECPVAFNKFFLSIFTAEDESTVPFVPDSDYPYMEPVNITADGISRLISNLKLSTSPGIYENSSKILKTLFPFPANYCFTYSVNRYHLDVFLQTGKLTK